MATAAQHRRGSQALSRDITAKQRKPDPALDRLLGSLEIAKGERDALALELKALRKEHSAAIRCLRSCRANHELQVAQWNEEKADLLYRLQFAAKHIRKLNSKP